MKMLLNNSHERLEMCQEFLNHLGLSRFSLNKWRKDEYIIKLVETYTSHELWESGDVRVVEINIRHFGRPQIMEDGRGVEFLSVAEGWD